MPAESPELIAVYGFLDRGGNFTLRRSYSTRIVRRWPHPNAAYALELLDQVGECVARVRPEVEPQEDCTSQGTSRWRVVGYIGMRETAARLRLTADGLVLWEADVPPAPTLRLQLGDRAPARERALELRLRCSPGNPDAFVQLVYQWGEQQFQTVGFFAPAERLEVDLRSLPGGRRCRLVAHYSNGMRSTGAATRYFGLPELGPQLAIVSPARGTSLRPGQPLTLIANVLDRERPGGAHPDADLTWWLDDEIVGRGAIACVQQPKPGRRRVRLRYEPSGTEVQVTVVVRAWEPGMPAPASMWETSGASRT